MIAPTAHFRRHFGSLLGALGLSWAGPGRSWAALGALVGALGTLGALLNVIWLQPSGTKTGSKPLLIKSQDSRIHGPQNEINCRILYTNKNQKLISHRSESDVCEMVLLIFLGNVGGTRLPNRAFMQKASC